MESGPCGLCLTFRALDKALSSFEGRNNEEYSSLGTVVAERIRWVAFRSRAANGSHRRLQAGKWRSDPRLHDRLSHLRTLSADKSNAVLFPTAFGWRSAGLAIRVGAGKLVDSAKYYVIAVDSLGDGVSSSPSNSKSQPGLSFPQFSIRDIVNVEQKAVSENMHIRHLHAVIG